ncbi:MAG: HAMP domain-containing protein [Labilithrix sp.]|nr:HAMP domain-containing protein [Labilithrix sp.]
MQTQRRLGTTPSGGRHVADTEDLSSREPRGARRARRDSNGRRAPSAATKSTSPKSTSTKRNGAGHDASETEALVSALDALHRGDFDRRLRPRDGVPREVQDAFNALAERLEHQSLEVARVTRVVGRDGEMGERLRMDGLRGGWEVIADSFNTVIGDLVRPSTEVARVIVQVAEGDLSQKMALEIDGKPIRGEFLRIGMTVNRMVDQLRAFASEVTRVAREVGAEGKLGGQADVPGVAGTWKDLTDNVNSMASNLTTQVRGIAGVVTAVANGDLSKKLVVETQGEILELKNTVNTMVDQLSSFAREVTRVATEVGTEGKLGGQATVRGVSGTWKDLTDSVNGLAGNLTVQLRDVSKVATAIASGDLGQKISVDVQGEMLQIKNVINGMVDSLSTFAAEVTRVAREVGSEGKLGGQANVPGVGGTWRDLTDGVNVMASNLTGQVRNIALVTTAVANGDLTQKITVDVKGEMLEMKNTINTMVDQLRSFAAEVTRVAREVGSEGKLGGQAFVPGVGGTWKDLTDSVNGMASNLTSQVRNIALITTAVANGDLSQKIAVDVKGEMLEMKNTINTMVDQLRSFAAEVTRVAREVGTEGKLGGQAFVPGVAGTWKDLTDNVNSMASNLTTQVRGIAKVVTAVANGDLSKRLVVEAKGEIAELAETINDMTLTLGIFADQVTTVAREVGSEGKLGGQARVPGVAGTWKDLTDNVNSMASNLTTQVRGIVKLVTAVADGDLSQKFTMDAQGEIAALADTLNRMTDTLGAFGSEVTRVAREVGTDGELGGQANVPGARGTWRDLVDHTNQLADNLTNQIRAMAEVARAITEGDLTRSITVEAQGEVAELKERVNEMIANLRETTQKNREQDWLKSNLARFGGLMQGQKSLESVSRLIMSELTPLVQASHAAFFVVDELEGAKTLKLLATYAYRERKHVANRFGLGEGLVGQAALEKKSILLTKVPGDYIEISSGLGEAPPLTIIVIPILFEDEVRAVVELASFDTFSAIHRIFLEQLSGTIGVVLNMIGASTRTEELLKQSQSLAHELQEQSRELQQQQDQLKRSNQELEQQAHTLRASEEMLREQQEELQQVNEELEEKASLLVEQNRAVEHKNREVELARQAVEEKASQLTLSSKYKSEFLANMSHELRTPLNSLLILARMLSDNKDANLTKKQVEYARTIHEAGSDLLDLINEVLDLSKVEAGKIEIFPADVAIADVLRQVEQTFRPLASQKQLDFGVDVDSEAPVTLVSDGQRLVQVLRNLIGNAFKFTDEGSVRLRVHLPSAETKYSSAALAEHAGQIVAFSVVDTGTGIPTDKRQLIFEAFQQADGTTSRRYGGTGLGLSISRELSRLLGGEIRVESEVGKGSTFTLYLPFAYAASGSVARGFDATPPEDAAPLPAGEVDDDREVLSPNDRVVLIVEDDPAFSATLLGIARDHGFKGVVALRGDTGLALARRLLPSAILLDLQLPQIDGLRILEHLKAHPQTRHIPVHILSGGDRKHEGLSLGAVAYVEKPVSKEALDRTFVDIEGFLQRKASRLLIVEDDERERQSMVELIGSDDVETTAVGSVDDALEALESGRFDCMVLDLTLKGSSGGTSDDARETTAGFELLERMATKPELRALPVIVYTGRELSSQEETRLKKFARSIILKDARSPERLLAETTLFLHRVEAELPQPKRRMLHEAAGPSSVFRGKQVLIVDDDVRNIYALSSVLEEAGMNVVFAENGRAGIEALEDNPGISIVLMDVMMPEMDGYETMRRIRQIPEHKALPVLALTAKAMKGDRDKCLAAGASDYVTKPVDPDQLLSLMRVWLYSHRE